MSASPRTEVLSDAELLLAVASSKDRDAFEELHGRYENPCYNLALNIAGRRETAEEAVQDAMLRIWRFAGSFKADGNARGWIMQTLAHSCLALLKKDAGDRKREQEVATQARDPLAPPEDHPQSELLDALRSAIARLPKAERRIVALYFGAELSQAEIGKELAISQRNVSGRLNRALESLRQALAQGGFAAAAPVLGSDLCAQALTSGHPVPPGLGLAIRARLAKDAVQESLRGGAHQANGTAKALLAAAVCAALGAAAYVWPAASGAQQTPAASDVSPAPPAASAAQSSAPRDRKETDIVWDFKRELCYQCKLLDAGTWNYVPPKDGRPGYLNAAGEEWALMPFDAPARPMHATLAFQLASTDMTKIRYGMYWSKERAVLPRTVYEYPVSRVPDNRTCTIEFYFYDRFIVSTLGGRVLSLSEYAKPYPTQTLRLSALGMRIDRFEFHEVTGAAIPDFVRAAVEQRHARRSASQPPVALVPSHKLKE